MIIARSGLSVLALALTSVSSLAPMDGDAAQHAGHAAASPSAFVDTVRQSTEPFRNVRDVPPGYGPVLGCVSGPEQGAMGVHFINVTVRGAPDPMKPNVLIYEPVGKELKLVAVEWLVPLTADTKKRPSLFGQPFMGPMEGHEPLIPKEYVHYDLHAWLFKDNPLGMFAPTNPDVNCEASDFSLLEKPTRMMPGP